MLGRRLLDEALKRVTRKKPEVVFALMHHPINWLAEFERKFIGERLRSDKDGADIVMTGHEHKDDHTQIHAGSGQAGFCAAGALYDVDTWAKTCVFDGQQQGALPGS